MNATLQAAITAAYQADTAFDLAVKQAGYKTRWDVGVIPQHCRALRDAYFAKIDADKAMHLAFEASRKF